MTATGRIASIAFAVVVAAGTLVAGPATAQDSGVRFFRIGTGATGGTYFAVGGLIANVISHPPGSRSCERGGSCGVPGLIAVAQSTQGSVQNIEELRDGRLESGLVQSDVAYWAYHGIGIFESKGAFEELRAIASLYPEPVHIVVRRDADVSSVADLAGKRVSLGEEGSGTLVDSRLILDAYGLSEERLDPRYLTVDEATDALENGDIDAFFFVGGIPAPAISALAQSVPISLINLAGDEGDKLRKDFPFFQVAMIPGGSYAGVVATETIAVSAQWVVPARLAEDLVYNLTRALWHENSRLILRGGHPGGRQLRLETAQSGVAIPLHDGAAEYYREIGLLRPSSD